MERFQAKSISITPYNVCQWFGNSSNFLTVWKIVNERYWELEMNQFKGFEEFNFFRAINPAFHLVKEEKRPGIVVGDQDTFQGYKELYDCK